DFRTMNRRQENQQVTQRRNQAHKGPLSLPIDASKVAICNGSSTSIRAVQLVWTNIAQRAEPTRSKLVSGTVAPALGAAGRMGQSCLYVGGVCVNQIGTARSSAILIPRQETG